MAAGGARRAEGRTATGQRVPLQRETSTEAAVCFDKEREEEQGQNAAVHRGERGGVESKKYCIATASEQMINQRTSNLYTHQNSAAGRGGGGHPFHGLLSLHIYIERCTSRRLRERERHLPPARGAGQRRCNGNCKRGNCRRHPGKLAMFPHSPARASATHYPMTGFLSATARPQAQGRRGALAAGRPNLHRGFGVPAASSHNTQPITHITA